MRKKINPLKVDPFSLPSLHINLRSYLPQCAAIYFVLQGEKILYIGRSTNLMRRWLQHHRLKEILSFKNELRIAWLECSEINLLTEIEKVLIKHLKPALNGRKPIVKSEASTKLIRDLKRLTIRDIPPSLHHWLKVEAVKRKITLGEFLVEICDYWQKTH